VPKALPNNVIAGLHPSMRTPTPTNVPEAPTLPRSCARKPWDGNVCVQRVVFLNRRMTRRGHIQGFSGKPRARRGKGAGDAVEVLQHLIVRS
jgi:hypothetical protein